MLTHSPLISAKKAVIVCHEQESWADWHSLEDMKAITMPNSKKMKDWEVVGPFDIDYDDGIGLHYPHRFYWCGSTGAAFLTKYWDAKASRKFAKVNFDKAFVTKTQLKPETSITVIKATHNTLILLIAQTGPDAPEPEYTQSKDSAKVMEYAMKYSCTKAYASSSLANRVNIYKEYLQSLLKDCLTITKCGGLDAKDTFDTEMSKADTRERAELGACAGAGLIEKEKAAIEASKKAKIDLAFSILKTLASAVPLGAMVAETLKLAADITDLVITGMENAKDIYDNAKELSGKAASLEITSEMAYFKFQSDNLIVSLNDRIANICNTIKTTTPSTPSRTDVCSDGANKKKFRQLHLSMK